MDFINILEKEFNRRITKNSGYSLRAFARDLAINQSSLSKVLTRKRQLSDSSILRIAMYLGLSVDRAKKFLNPQTRGIKHPLFTDLDFERFSIVSEWYHDAILELIDTETFKPDSKWIAERLGITENQAKFAVRKLVNVGLMGISKSGNWIDRSKDNSIHADSVSPSALKIYQKQILGNSIKAIDSVDLTKRSHTSNTFSASSEKIEEAKKIIEKCRKDVATLLRSSKNPKTDVYQIQISLFPITSNKGKQI